MAYAVITASYQEHSLALSYAGLDGDQLADFPAAEKKAIGLLITALTSTTVAGLHDLVDDFLPQITAVNGDLRQLPVNLPHGLVISWLGPDHCLLAVMDDTEAFQLHIEIVPV